jgi:hypothetical protein
VAVVRGIGACVPQDDWYKTKQKQKQKIKKKKKTALREQIFLSPHWLVSVMSRLVTWRSDAASVQGYFFSKKKKKKSKIRF